LRDLLLFFAFSGVPIAAFLLQDYPSTEFFTTLLVIFLIILLWLRTYHKERNQIVDYDENLSLGGLVWVAGGVISVYFVASFIVNTFAISSIYVPFKGLTVTYGTWELAPIWNDFLFNIALVAPAEECCKLVLHLATYMKLKDSLSKSLAWSIAAGLPIGIWAVLHAYTAYTGPHMPTLIISAFMGGLIIFAVMWKTKSLLGAILTHAGYNCLVVYLAQGLKAV